jgi:gluconolactonase
VEPARGSGPLHSFLEGPAFDREGRLYCVDVCHGRIFRIDRDGTWEVFAEYAGNPNGLKIHRDGRIFVADHHLGLLAFDPRTGARTTVAEGAPDGPFRGLNDLVFADNGDLYFTDPAKAGSIVPTGACCACAPAGRSTWSTTACRIPTAWCWVRARTCCTSRSRARCSAAPAAA